MGRKYELKRRAERQGATRRRIVEATVALHEARGVADTTISAIAERAGVERATVYRHFPDDRSLLTACTGHYLAAHPPPDPASFDQIADPEQRLRAGLAEVYAYHRRTEAMTAKALRDLPQIPMLAEVLASGWVARDPDDRLVRAAIGHAIDFQTWRSLAREGGLDDPEAVALMVTLACCLARMCQDDDRAEPTNVRRT
jgi:AcrR family transcriptional regulator